jgi:flagellar FliJ protein
MKAFDFSLEKILEVREFNERQSEIELGNAISETNRIQHKLKDIAKQKVEVSQNRYAKPDIQSLLLVEHYITRLDKEKEKLLNNLALAELEVEKKRAKLAEAMKERKVMSKLKEKQLKIYKKEKNKKEEQEIDDISKNFHF